jgi:chlorophyllase-like protein
MTRYIAAVVLGTVFQLACSSPKSASPSTGGAGTGGPGASSQGSGSSSGSSGGGGALGADASSSGGGGGGSLPDGGSSGGGGPVDAAIANDAAATSGATDAPSAGQGAGADVAVAGDASDGAYGGDTATAGPAAWPAVTDYSTAGPFTPTRQVDVGPGAAYDVFQPTILGAENRKHPIISWANGTLYSVDDYAPLLQHWASHGFVVIANHTNTTAGGGTHKAGIDWMVSEDARPASPYFGVLDVTKIGAAGHSQGGGATIAAGANAPGTTGITTTIPLMALLSFETDPTIVSRQLVPMFDIVATMDVHDPTGMIANQIYDGAATNELVQGAFIGVHEDAMNAKMHAPTVAWFRWKLMADVQAKAFFYPVSTCSLCQNADWKSVRYKNPSP